MDNDSHNLRPCPPRSCSIFGERCHERGFSHKFSFALQCGRVWLSTGSVQGLIQARPDSPKPSDSIICKWCIPLQLVNKKIIIDEIDDCSALCPIKLVSKCSLYTLPILSVGGEDFWCHYVWSYEQALATALSN